MGKHLLEIKDIAINYVTDEFTVHAVNGVSLTLAKGSTLGLVGETGAGKTTTALSVMGLLPPKTGKVLGGQVLFEGQDLLTLSGREMDRYRGKSIAMIYQDPMTSLNPTMTIGKQIGEVLEAHNICEKSEVGSKVAELLNLVGILPERSGEYPHQFSGGMKQRVVIAMALACNPTLLIADEPTTALDVTIQAQVLEMMKQLKDKLGTSMLLITHDLGIVGETCDSVAIMYAGEIVESGEVEEVFGNPKHPYTIGLMGSVPNINTKIHRLRPITGLMPDPTSLPAGCKFNPRCTLAQDICKSEHPGNTCRGSHVVRCHVNKFGSTQEAANE